MSSLLEDSKLLNRLCDDLVSFKIAADDILADEEKVVSSTESSPVKLSSKSKKSSASKRVLELSRRL